jgi:molecular chaperone DnaK
MDEILLGIDFGTTNTVISYFNNNKSNIMSDGVYKMIPSKIGYIEDRVYCGNYIPLNCDNIVHSFKLLDDNSEYLIIFFKHIYDLIIKNLKCDVIKAVINNNIKAVITVPSNFNDTQRENIRRCFNLVNIKVIRIINEPSSAALAYGMNSSSNTFEKILVIDTGGGTMDFTILEKSEMFFEVIDSRGLNNLGGNNFTDIIFNYFKDLSWNNCQKMKEKLSYLDSFEIKDNNKNYFMTRNTFNNLTQELIKQMEEILTEMCINIDINHIILVGGTSRIPILQESIKKIMNKNIWIHPNLETVVAEGAGLYCGIIENKYKSIDDIILLDVVPLSLGIELADGTYSIIIPKNTPLPVKRTNKYTTESSSESSVKIKIYQGERTIASKNFLIGEYIFDKISTIAVPIIEITFKIDLNSIINVIITDKKSGIDKNIIIKDIVKYSEEEVDDIIKKSSKLNTLDENELTINQNIYLIKSFIEKILINLSVNELIDKIKKEEILMNIQEIENKLETYTYLQLIETLKNLETNYSLLGTIYEDNEINNNNNNNNNNNMLLLDKKLELEDKVKSLLEIHPEWEEYLTPVLENLSYTNVSIEYINEKLNDIKELE